MPSYVVHLTIGLIMMGFLVFYLKIFHLGGLIQAFVIALVYSLLPDLDHRHSKIRIYTLIIGLLFIVFFYIIGKLFFAFSIIVGLFALNLFKHRGLLHRILIGILLSLPLLFLGYSLALVGFACYMSHLLIDWELKLI